MKNITLWKIVLIVIALFGTYAIFWHPGPKVDTSLYEFRIQQDSAIINQLNDSIESLNRSLASKKTEYDTIEKLRVVYRDRFDTDKAAKVIADTTVDSTCRRLLSECVDLNRVNEYAISQLKSIQLDQDLLIGRQNEKIQILERQIALKDEYINNQKSTYKKDLRKTKLIAGALVTFSVVAAVLAR